METTAARTILAASVTLPDSASRASSAAASGWLARSATLREGLTASTAALEGPEVEADRARGVAAAFRPEGAWQAWLVAQVVALMGRLARSEPAERALRDRASYRAIEFWDEDRALAADELGAKLADRPARTVAKLRQTPAGLDWLAARWRGLAAADPTTWDDDGRTLAAQLVGGDPTVDPTAPGFAAAQLADLAARRARAEEADAVARALVVADLDDDAVPGLARLRRDARALQRRLQWALAELRAAHPASVVPTPPFPEIRNPKTNPTPPPIRPATRPALAPIRPDRANPSPTARAESTDRLVALLSGQHGLEDSWIRNCLEGLDDLEPLPPSFVTRRPR